MAVFGALQLLDDFNRANEATLTGNSRWTTGGLTNPATGLKLTSNAVTRQSPGGAFGRDGSFYNAFTFPTSVSCWAAATVATMSVGGSSGNGGELDIQLFATSSRNGYELNIVDVNWNGGSTAGLLAIDRVAAGATTSIASTSAGAFTPASGDTYAILVDTNDIVAYVQRGGIVTEVLRVTDTTYRTLFTAGMEMAGQTETTSMVVDDFCGNWINPGPMIFQPVPFVASGRI